MTLVITATGMALSICPPRAVGQIAATTQLQLERSGNVIPMPTSVNSAEWPLPRWQNGLLIYRRESTTSNALPNIYAYDGGGKLALQHTVWLTGAGQVVLRGYTVSSDHHLAVAGVALGPAGRTNFVREIQPNGLELRTIDTGGYFPSLVAYDVGGDLWVAGSATGGDLHYSQETGVLRRYHLGKLEGEYLPYSSFSTKYVASSQLGIHPAEHTGDSKAFLLPLAKGGGRTVERRN